MEKVTEERSGAIVEEFLNDEELDLQIVHFKSSISILQKELRNEELEIMENRAPSSTISDKFDKLYNDLRQLSSLYSSKANLVLGRALDIQQKKCDFLVRTLCKSVPDNAKAQGKLPVNSENSENPQGKLPVNSENSENPQGKLPVNSENPQEKLPVNSENSENPQEKLPVNSPDKKRRAVVHLHGSSGSLLEKKKARAKRFGIPFRDEPDKTD